MISLLPFLRGPVPSPRLAPVSNLQPELLLWGVNGTGCEDTQPFPMPVPLWIISSAPMTSPGREFGTALPEHQMSVSLPSQAQPSRWATKIFPLNCLSVFITIPEMQDEGLSNILDVLWGGKNSELNKTHSLFPIPLAFLVSTHTNKLHRAGSGTQLPKVFQFLAQFWLQSVNTDPEIPSCEDLVAGLETTLVVVTLLWRLRTLSQWFFIYYG